MALLTATTYDALLASPKPTWRQTARHWPYTLAIRTCGQQRHHSCPLETARSPRSSLMRACQSKSRVFVPFWGALKFAESVDCALAAQEAFSSGHPKVNRTIYIMLSMAGRQNCWFSMLPSFPSPGKERAADKQEVYSVRPLAGRPEYPSGDESAREQG